MNLESSGKTPELANEGGSFGIDLQILLNDLSVGTLI